MRQNPPSVARVAALRASRSLVAEFCRKLMKELFDPYRPELHYMRGPGPKWRERHGIPPR